MSIFDAARHVPRAQPERVQLAAVLGGVVFLALVAISTLPAARGTSAWFGPMPLWLLGMPLASIAALALSRRTPHRAQQSVPPMLRRVAPSAASSRPRPPARQAVRKTFDKAA